ncbi:Fungal N-terminal domain-containing protein [Madurella fahalii]|uniref:Fungal N-terminal domain-containing protein n=1 Tax=Madurella fahalii TaxID=1157608 RepID=A0ABQ0G1V4_9PEZI
MEVGLTVGSLGDIIAVCQTAIQLGRAIGHSQYGSATSYQDLTTELDMFVRVLMQVVATYPRHEFTPYLAGLDTTVKEIVNECGSLIQEALDRWRTKYHFSLSSGGSGNRVRDAGRKMEWALREQERAKELREKLSRGIERMTLLSALATQRSARGDNATMMARLEEVKRLLSQNHDVQDAALRLSQDQTTQLYALSERMKNQEESGWAILSQAKRTFNAVLGVKDMVSQACQAMVELRALVISRSLDPTQDMPLIVEDALGNIIKIPLDLVHSWEMFHLLLAHQFEDRRGHARVVRGQYALEEACTCRDIDASLPWMMSVRRGMKINMSIIFESATVVVGYCPRCETKRNAPEDVTVQCSNTPGQEPDSQRRLER